MAEFHIFQVEPLRAAVSELMHGFGSEPREIELVTDNLVQANLTGHDFARNWYAAALCRCVS